MGVEKISTTSSETTENSSENSFLIKDDENSIQTESEIMQQMESIKELQSEEVEDDLRFSVYQLLAILLVFCLLLFALNVMWNNFYTTLFISFVSFPILRWFGKI